MHIIVCVTVSISLQATAEANNLNAQNAARDRYIKEMEKVRLPLCTVSPHVPLHV